MIPLSDQSTVRRRFPVVTVGIIVINVLVFVYQFTLNEQALQLFVYSYGMRPAEITLGRDLAPLVQIPVWGTLFTSMFMHGGFMHIIGNMLYLWVFGDTIEDVLNRVPFIIFYVVCGLTASAAQIFTDPTSGIPNIGASGAVAGVLGAYLVLFPKHRINTLLTLGYFWRMVQLPAMLVLGFWIVIQFFTGLTSFGVQTGVAYWAHVGGFAIGAALAAPIAISYRMQRRNRSPWEQ